MNPLLLLLLLPLLLPISAAFLPPDNYLLNCGATAAATLATRRFLPDSTLTLSPTPRNAANTTTTSIFATARVFTSPTNYTFLIRKPGRHFIRLHFNPVTHYLQHSLFSVSVDIFTLFNNCQCQHSLVTKEYVIESSNQLIISLSPSNGSIAFINAIEVISLPEGLIPAVAAPVPAAASVKIPDNVALETVYRVNMGGGVIGVENDSLWRDWVSDQPFLINPNSARSVSAGNISIRYPPGVSVSEYVAPVWVYATAEEMADANVGNQNFNVSWAFDVDSGFRYLLRLHFCDFISGGSSKLMFDVYINNQSALRAFDVSGKVEFATAHFVDFVVDVNMEVGRILVQIGPSELSGIQPNAILNGLEIMKLSNADGSLDASHSSNRMFDTDTMKTRALVIVLALCLGGATLLGLIVAALILYFHRRKKAGKKHALAWLPPTPLPYHMSVSETKVSAGSYASSGPSQGLGQILPFQDIREATQNFDESLVLGVGGFGKVYKGVLDTGLVVAVKRGNPRSQQGLVEFKTEIEMLSKLRHRHLVSLIGYCHEPNEMVLVYEYMAGGPLQKHLYGSNIPTLSWNQRLEICIGAAKGLHYLHTGAAETIIHRDVKTTNILLDENLTAKVADFGLSKLGPTLDQTHVSTVVKGSFGYLDPEYFRRQQLTEKSDVYSFGVVLIEVLCARPAINPSLPRDQVNIVEWALNWQKQGQLERIIDPHLVGTVSLDSLRKFGETAEKCLAEYGIERPTMGDVLWNLEYAFQLQESFTKNVTDGNNTNNIQDFPEWIPHITRNENNDLSFVSGTTESATSRVFSQLLDPKGR